MHKTPVWVIGILAGLGVVSRAPALYAADPVVSISTAPVREVMVDGDREKFRAQHWMKDGYAGGISDLSIRYDLPDGTHLFSESHALIDQNDLGALLSLRKAGVGFVSVDYDEFRKFYDNTGGVYNRFTTLSASDTPRDLALNLGRLGVETGMAVEGLPELTLRYEREFKDGTKSRLAWTPLTEGSVTRLIGPSWQDVDESVDTVTVSSSHEVAGIALRGEQRWEFDRAEVFREERSLSTNSTASEKKIRRQDQAPEALLMTTTLNGERWFWEDKAVVSGAYHFAHMDNREFESLLEFNANGVQTTFSNPKQQLNARADNDYDTHTWVGSARVAPWPWLSLGTKLKSEVINRDSNSTYPADAVPNSAGGSTPNGIIDRFDVSLNRAKAARWGEGLSVRCTAIPRTALYTELEFEQARLFLREDRQSLDGPDAGDGTSSGEVFNRETVTLIRRGAWTFGGQVVPWRMLNLTAHVRHRINNNDYDDQRESAGGGTARSAFIDGQSVHTNEVATRATFTPCRRLRSSVRYQFRGDGYSTHVEAQQLVKTSTRSHTYTLDVTLQPLDELMTTASFSRQTAATVTPASLSSSAAAMPTFNSTVNTWLFSAEYSPRANLTLTGTLQYAKAGKFNDFSSSGLPLGVDNTHVDLITGVTWAMGADASLAGEYGFYHFQANANAEAGDYDAHVISLKVSKAF